MVLIATDERHSGLSHRGPRLEHQQQRADVRQQNDCRMRSRILYLGGPRVGRSVDLPCQAADADLWFAEDPRDPSAPRSCARSARCGRSACRQPSTAPNHGVRLGWRDLRTRCRHRAQAAAWPPACRRRRDADVGPTSRAATRVVLVAARSSCRSVGQARNPLLHDRPVGRVRLELCGDPRHSRRGPEHHHETLGHVQVS